MEVADLGALHTFPECDSVAHLTRYLGRWMSLVQTQGQDLTDRHLRTMRLKMIGPEARDEVKQMKLNDAHYMVIVNRIKGEAGRLADKRVAKLHIQQRRASLPGSKKSVNAVLEAPAEAEDPETKVLANTLSMVCAALEKFQKRGRSTKRDDSNDKARRRSQSPRRGSPASRSMPNRTFPGCWHCGGTGHSRTRGRGRGRNPACETFAKRLKGNKGLPKDYEWGVREMCKAAGQDPATNANQSSNHRRAPRGRCPFWR